MVLKLLNMQTNECCITGQEGLPKAFSTCGLHVLWGGQTVLSQRSHLISCISDTYFINPNINKITDMK